MPSSFSLRAPVTAAIYTLSLRDALPIWHQLAGGHRAVHDRRHALEHRHVALLLDGGRHHHLLLLLEDRKSTRLNSSHSQISYAVFCLKKKTARSVSR